MRAVNDLANLLAATRQIATQARQRLAGIVPDGATRRVSLHDGDARPIAKGEAFSTENLTAKRPGGGVDPYSYWAMLGQPANRSYDADEVIDP